MLALAISLHIGDRNLIKGFPHQIHRHLIPVLAVPQPLPYLRHQYRGDEDDEHASIHCLPRMHREPPAVLHVLYVIEYLLDPILVPVYVHHIRAGEFHPVRDDGEEPRILRLSAGNVLIIVFIPPAAIRLLHLGEVPRIESGMGIEELPGIELLIAFGKPYVQAGGAEAYVSHGLRIDMYHALPVQALRIPVALHSHRI